MSNAIMLIPIFLPIICGAVVLGVKFGSDRLRNTFVMSSVLATSVIAFVLMFTVGEDLFTLLTFTGDLTLALKLDGMGRIFAGLAAVLWVLPLRETSLPYTSSTSC